MPVLSDGTAIRIRKPLKTPTKLVVVRGPRGLRGPSGTSGLNVFEYQMPVAQTTAVIDHDLERDPVAVQVMVDGQQVEEYSVVFTVPQQQVTIGFDIPAAAMIRLI